MTQAYAKAISQVAFAHDGSFAGKGVSEAELYEAAKEAVSGCTHVVGCPGPEGSILAGGAMRIQYDDAGNRVVKIVHLFRSPAAAKGSGEGVLQHMLRIARANYCGHAIGQVRKDNLAVVPWYESVGFSKWHTDCKGNIWIHQDLAPLHSDGQNVGLQPGRRRYLDPYIWAESTIPAASRRIYLTSMIEYYLCQ